jgi:hypothetical protein
VDHIAPCTDCVDLLVAFPETAALVTADLTVDRRDELDAAGSGG